MGFQRVGHDWVNSLCGSAGKESAWNVGGLGSIPGLWRSPGEGKSYPLQYFGLENSIDYIVHGVAKSRTQLSDFHSPTHSVFGWVPSFLTLCETVLRWGPQSVRRFLRETELQVFKIVITSVLVWRIPGTGEPGGLPSMGSHRVGHDWSDLAAAAFWLPSLLCLLSHSFTVSPGIMSQIYLLLPKVLSPGLFLETSIYWVNKLTEKWGSPNILKLYFQYWTVWP